MSRPVSSPLLAVPSIAAPPPPHYYFPLPEEPMGTFGSLSGLAASCLSISAWLNPRNETCSTNCLIRTAGKVIRYATRFLMAIGVGLVCGSVGILVNPLRSACFGISGVYHWLMSHDHQTSARAFSAARVALEGWIEDLIRANILCTVLFAFAFASTPDFFETRYLKARWANTGFSLPEVDVFFTSI